MPKFIIYFSNSCKNCLLKKVYELSIFFLIICGLKPRSDLVSTNIQNDITKINNLRLISINVDIKSFAIKEGN
ncbi:hypothetical protein L6452_21921 [Arctium lappa]|uniref:Uncharacterized protein n=1 Tax=Arctium lappa TaxID=4217 RepID=A0ACB9AYR0_ARCLA|nr:hypothetical protein L6452_21921 [Arctium lappa]